MITKKILLFVLFSSVITFAQFKGDESKSIDMNAGILSDNPMNSIFNFVDMSKFSMGHSFSMSYSAMGNDGLALGVYTNKIAYEFSEKLNFEVNTSFVNSPYNSYGENFTKGINGIYIDRARINYNPSEDFNVSLEFSNSPFNYYNSYNSRRYSPFGSYLYRD